jgi:pilus assembly protein Flp/PilA
MQNTKQLCEQARRFLSDNSGATAIEYAIVALIGVGVIAIVTQIGGSVNSLYQKVVDAF